MKLAIMQPYFFPYIGYFQLMAAVDRFVVYDDVNYIKRGWINRNRILLNGNPHTFTIPVLKASQNVSIANTLINPEQKWRKKLLISIEHAYKNAPHFKQVFPMVERVVLSNTESIADFALRSLREVITYLELSTEIIQSSSIYGNQELKGSDRILDICLKEGASHYINPPGGAELYNRQTFKEAGVDLSFIHTSEFLYNQQQVDFVENLSMIDVLMFNSRSETIELLKCYRLA